MATFLRFGGWIDRYSERVGRLSGYSINPRFIKYSITFLANQGIASGIGLGASLALNLNWLTPLFAALLTSSLMSMASLSAYVVAKIGARAAAFDRSMVNILLVMTPMVASGAPLVEILRTLASMRWPREVEREFRMVMAEVTEGGVDVIEALRRSVDRVPSRLYADVMGLLAEAYGVTSELADILMLKLDSIIRERYVRLRALVQTLALVIETYLVIALMLPTLIVLIALSLSPLGPAQFGPITLDVNSVLALTTMIYVPMMGALFYTFINYLMSRAVI